jgi:hypothetical protein
MRAYPSSQVHDIDLDSECELEPHGEQSTLEVPLEYVPASHGEQSTPTACVPGPHGVQTVRCPNNGLETLPVAQGRHWLPFTGLVVKYWLSPQYPHWLESVAAVGDTWLASHGVQVVEPAPTAYEPDVQLVHGGAGIVYVTVTFSEDLESKPEGTETLILLSGATEKLAELPCSSTWTLTNAIVVEILVPLA